jgi:hypothetical protein
MRTMYHAIQNFNNCISCDCSFSPFPVLWEWRRPLSLLPLLWQMFVPLGLDPLPNRPQPQRLTLVGEVAHCAISRRHCCAVYLFIFQRRICMINNTEWEWFFLFLFFFFSITKCGKVSPYFTSLSSHSLLSLSWLYLGRVHSSGAGRKLTFGGGGVVTNVLGGRCLQSRTPPRTICCCCCRRAGRYRKTAAAGTG